MNNEVLIDKDFTTRNRWAAGTTVCVLCYYLRMSACFVTSDEYRFEIYSALCREYQVDIVFRIDTGG